MWITEKQKEILEMADPKHCSVLFLIMTRAHVGFKFNSKPSPEFSVKYDFESSHFLPNTGTVPSSFKRWLVFNIFFQGRRRHQFAFIVNRVYKLYIFTSPFVTSNKPKWYSHKYSIIEKILLNSSIHSFTHSISSFYARLCTIELWLLPFLTFSSPPLHNELVYPVGSSFDFNGCMCVSFPIASEIYTQRHDFCSSFSSFL